MRGTKTLKFVVVLAVCVGLFPAGGAGRETGLPIIPGAGGFGITTPAGSGRHLEEPQTRVIRVTNLNDAGPGSLRAALAAEGPRVVVFEVSGYIELDSGIGINNPYVTVAGQTAPWPGIVLRGGHKIGVRTHDVLIQHIGIRPGGQIKGQYIPHRGSMSVRGENVVIDHCSMGWSQQAAMNLTGRNTTLRLNIFSEGLYHAGHNEANHSKGIGVGLGHQSEAGKREGIAIIGNLFAHNDGRNPQVSQNSSVAILNNVVYDHAAVGIKMMKDPLVATIQGNVFIAGPDTVDVPGRPWRGKAAWIYLNHAESSVYLARDNVIDGKAHENPWEQINARRVMGQPDSDPIPEGIVWEPPVVVPGHERIPGPQAEQWVLDNVGPRPADRGPIDARTVFETRTRTGRGRDDVADAGGWPDMEENYRELNVPENPNHVNEDGYTNLEKWLHRFADEVEGRTGNLAGAHPKLGRREAIRCVNKPNAEELRAKIEMIQNLPEEDWTLDTEEAKSQQRDAAEEAGLPLKRSVDLGGGVEMDLVLIPPGEFEMGSKYPPEVTKWRGPGRIRGSSAGRRGSVPLYGREYPARRVRVSEPYYIGTHELTWAEWERVMETDAPKADRLPAMLLTGWQTTERTQNVEVFIKRLNETIGPEVGLTFRLPTEVEWEYACRAGTDTPFWFGEKISADRANYDAEFPWDGRKGEFRGKLMEVGSFEPNPWGLYDTVGNAAELVSTRYGPYPDPPDVVTEAEEWTKLRKKMTWGGTRTVRGGSYAGAPADCRSAYGAYLPVYGGRERGGLRVVAQPR